MAAKQIFFIAFELDTVNNQIYYYKAKVNELKAKVNYILTP